MPVEVEVREPLVASLVHVCTSFNSMMRVALLALFVLQFTHAQDESWGCRSTRHVTLGRVSISTSRSEMSISLWPESSSDEAVSGSPVELDTSRWVASNERIDPVSITRSSATAVRPFSRFAVRRQGHHHDGTVSASSRTLLRKRKVKEDAAALEEVEEGAPSREVLESVVQPLVPTYIWDKLTGKEFDLPATVVAMAKTGLKMTRRSNNEWVDWKAADKVTSQVEKGDEEENEVLTRGDVLVYKGAFRKDGYGSKLPVIKARSILPLAPQELAELLMDSSRVKTYNSMSIGRNDVKVLQKGINTHGGPFGDGETKIVRNLTKPPLTKKTFECVTMMHARPISTDDALEPRGYLVVSRAVAGDIWESGDENLTRNEILLGVNVIQETLSGNPNECMLTSVTHVYSPSVPIMLAGSAGVKGAVDFVRDIRKLGQSK